MTLKTPVISIILGEGGSGGALALAVCDELAMLENAIYSVISPRGFASILWKDSTRADEAAELMKLKSGDLYQMQVVDKVFSEPDVLNIESMERLCLQLKGEIMMFLKKYQKKKGKYILTNRYERFRKF